MRTDFQLITDFTTIVKYSFVTDDEKMDAYFYLEKEEFLESYSYLSEFEYECTTICVELGLAVNDLMTLDIDNGKFNQGRHRMLNTMNNILISKIESEVIN